MSETTATTVSSSPELVCRVCSLERPVLVMLIYNLHSLSSCTAAGHLIPCHCRRLEYHFAEIIMISIVQVMVVCIFAYGQTGSGKTHTMMGTPGDRGLINRLIEQILEAKTTLKEYGWKYDFRVNERSFRSHFIFTLHIAGTNETIRKRLEGVLNLVDLAGSENVSKSGADGVRLKEAGAINKSLLALTSVIMALANKSGHVPYRDSKLTLHLKDYLGGDSKTLLMVNVSPAPTSVHESLNSLRFATRVNACEIRRQ